MTMTIAVRAAHDRAVHQTDPALRLRVQGLNVGFANHGAVREIVHDLSFDLQAGRCVAIVGESGSGKSVTARTLVGLTGAHSLVRATQLRLFRPDAVELDLTSQSARSWRSIRGARIGFILQDALTSLDPLRAVGKEIDEALRLHGRGDRSTRRRVGIELLASMGVPRPELRARQRAGELSGGLRQRALIASAIALDPEIVIADEPTTALDVTVQAQVLDLLNGMKARGSSIVLISHDLSVVASLADEILVMRRGAVVEQGPAQQILHRPSHPYTRTLINAVPGAHTRGERLAPTQPEVPSRHLSRPGARTIAPNAGDPILSARGIVKHFLAPDGTRTRAVDTVSFELFRGETLGIVGESGSGKSTTARIALSLEAPDEGEVVLLGQPWSATTDARRRRLRAHIGMVPQDPLSSFDPRWTTARILLDAIPSELGLTDVQRRDRLRDLLAQVALADDVLERLPLYLSGGQRQRIAIARALAASPEIIVLDEAVSALDVSVQAQILDLLQDLQREYALSYLFISHDLGVIRHMSDRVLVMKDGVVVESGETEEVFLRPRHAYTRQLIRALPRIDGPSVPPAGRGAPFPLAQNGSFGNA